MAQPAEHPQGEEHELLANEAVALVERWLAATARIESDVEQQASRRLHDLVSNPAGLAFAMRFVDRVMRPESSRVAALQLRRLVDSLGAPRFLSVLDRTLLRLGARMAPLAPALVMPIAERRMRQLVGHLVVEAEPAALRSHLAAMRAAGFRQNVNVLGEAVLGEGEAERRRAALLRMIAEPDVDYVSVKVSAIVPQLHPWAFDANVARVAGALRPLFEAALASSPPTFINLDMEEYRDLELTLAAFMAVLDEPELRGADAGIAIQAYLPDSFAALQQLVDWASDRRRGAERMRSDAEGHRAGGIIKVRLVKGANLAMERVEAAVHGWPRAPYDSKLETDANFKRCLEWLLTPERTDAVRLGLASHNLFDLAWGHLLSVDRGVDERVELEMLQGMAPAQAEALAGDGHRLLLYTPVVARTEFDVAIAYLFRRLEENAAEQNFIRRMFGLQAGSSDFEVEAAKFRNAVERRSTVDSEPRRTQDRRSEAPRRSPELPFANEPDTDPALRPNREWAADVLRRSDAAVVSTPLAAGMAAVNAAIASARDAQIGWAGRSAAERRPVLWSIADELARRRDDLVAAMVHEAGKTIAEADPEVSEAIDFARWYGDRALELDARETADFTPLGVIAVVPPWNFPVAIPAGGVLASLAAANGVVLKPAPETPRCAEIVAECCWSAGLPEGLLQFVRTPDNELGRHLITHPAVNAVILTGAYETAGRFRSWRPDLRIFAETSGKNAMVITPSADIDLAVGDLVASAFGHSGQKCSAASLAICVGDAYESPRLRRQLVDAVVGLEIGAAAAVTTAMGPTIKEPEGKLLRGLTTLDSGEQWLVEPRRLADRLWTPGIRLGVAPRSWFHQTECFGPVLGLMPASDLDDAIDIQNSTPFGLTGGIHSLDPEEIASWLDGVRVGNAYVNRRTTGAIVGRQPFGGWKRSVVGPGAKAGGPNYVAQLGFWTPTDTDLADDAWLAAAAASDEHWWRHEFSRVHELAGLFCEANELRYRPLPKVAIRIERGTPARELQRVLSAAATCGVRTVISDGERESPRSFADRLSTLGVLRVRVLGGIAPVLREPAHAAGIHLADDPVTSDGRVELLHYLREQSISRTLHRHGNVFDAPTGADPVGSRP